MLSRGSAAWPLWLPGNLLNVGNDSEPATVSEGRGVLTFGGTDDLVGREGRLLWILLRRYQGPADEVRYNARHAAWDQQENPH